MADIARVLDFDATITERMSLAGFNRASVDNQVGAGLDGFRAVLEEHGNAHAFEYVKMAAEDGVGQAVDLTRAKEHFSKLKFNYLELSTKENFMDGVGRMNPAQGGFHPDAAVEALEAGVRKAKWSLKKIKASNVSLKEQIAQAAADIQVQHDDFLARGAALEELGERAFAPAAGDDGADEADIDAADVDAMRETVAAEAEELRLLALEFDQIQEQVREAEMDAGPMVEQAAALRAQVGAHEMMERRAAQAAQHADAGGVHAEMAAWYEPRLALLERLTGGMDVDNLVHEPVEPEFAKLPLPDIVREQAARRANAEFRRSEVAKLALRFVVSDNAAMGRLVATLPSGMIVHVHCDSDYPAASQPVIVRIDSPRGGQEQLSTRVTTAKTLTELFDIVKTF